MKKKLNNETFLSYFFLYLNLCESFSLSSGNVTFSATTAEIH